MTHVWKCVIAVLVFGSLAIGGSFETGYVEWTQPDEKTFMGKAWGDEYSGWFETEDGYRFVTGPDGWHYYATLDEWGEFALF
jgi:hypothetical protein